MFRLNQLKTRGAQSVEYILVLGGVALAAVIGYRGYRASVERKVHCQGARVTALAGDGSNCDDQGLALGTAAATSPPGAPAGSVVCDASGGCTGTSCFVAGTMVDVPGGQIPIESLQVGDFVVADHEQSGERGARKITRTFRTENREVARLVLEDRETKVRETILATPEHPFFVIGLGFTPVSQLRPGESYVARRDGQPSEVVELQSLPDRGVVYNLEVEGAHTYFVGASHAWVHNTCGANGSAALQQVAQSANGQTKAQPNYGPDNGIVPQSYFNKGKALQIQDSSKHPITGKSNTLMGDRPPPPPPFSYSGGSGGIGGAGPTTPSIQADNRTPEQHIEAIYNRARIEAGLRPGPPGWITGVIGQLIERVGGVAGGASIPALVFGTIHPFNEDYNNARYMAALERDRAALEFWMRQILARNPR